MPERSTTDIATLLVEALRLPQEARVAFLDHACAGNAAQRRDLEALLAAHEQAGDFLQRAAMPTGALQERIDADPAPPAEDVGSMIGRYKLLQLIGEGGFGSVYMAEQEQPVRRRVALKVIKLGMDTKQVIARFEAERQALAIMDHPNIARVFDAGSTFAGRPYFAMELVKGAPITEYCDRHRLPLGDRLTLFEQVCLAVQHAHTKGIIHRDLKPSNLLVSGEDGRPQPKVIDFGIAKATSGRLTEQTSLTEACQFVGTPAYMSPERAGADAADVDTRADVYSLGVVLYELLTGTTPLDSERLRSATYAEMQRMIREEEPPKPSTRLSALKTLPDIAAHRSIEPRRLTTRLQGDLDWIVLKALDKSRERRYGSAADLAEDVRRHLRDEPVLARPPSASYRMKKFVRRHRLGVIAASSIALAVAGGMVGTAVGLVQARAATKDARDAAQQTQLVNDFVRDVLTSVQTEEQGSDVRFLTVLDDGWRVAAQRFTGHPVQEAAVRGMLGDVYANLALWPDAITEYRQAVTLLDGAVAPDDRRLLHAQVQLARSLVGDWQDRDARTLLDQLVPRIQAALGPNDELCIEAECYAVVIQRHKQGEPVVGTLHERSERAQRKTQAMIGAMRELRQRADRVNASDRLQIILIDWLIFVLRPTRPVGADASSVRVELVALARELVDRSSRVSGPDALRTHRQRNILASFLLEQGDFAAAAQTCRTVLAATEGRLSPCHVTRRGAMGTLADALHGLGDAAAAVDLRLQLINCARGFTVDVLTGTIRASLPEFDRAGRWTEGEALAREMAAELRKAGGGRDDMLFVADMYVARFASLQGRSDEAEQLFQALLARKDKAKRFTVPRLHLFLGSHLTQRGLYEEAERELQAVTGLQDDYHQGTWGANPDDVLLEFIALYQAWGKPEKAAEYERLRDDALRR